MHRYGCDKMNFLWPNESIFSGLDNISLLSKPNLTTFAKNVKLGLLRKEMLSKPLNMLSFGHEMFMLSKANPFL